MTNLTYRNIVIVILAFVSALICYAGGPENITAGAGGAATDVTVTTWSAGAIPTQKVNQPVFARAAIATATGTLFSAVVDSVDTSSTFVITFEQACYMGPATTTAATIVASGTKMAAGTQIEIKPGAAIDFGILGNGAVASFSSIRFPLM